MKLTGRKSTDFQFESSHYQLEDGEKVPLRIYHPKITGRTPAVILYPGASPTGEKHEIVNQVAIGLSKIGFRVFLPRLPSLMKIMLGPDSVEHIIKSFEQIYSRNDILNKQIVAIGFSFGGSLLIKACTDKRINGLPVVVLSYGSYYDLRETFWFAISGEYNDGLQQMRMKPHEWGKVVFFYNYLNQIPIEFDREKMKSYFYSLIQEDDSAAEYIYMSMNEEDKKFIDLIYKDEKNEIFRLAKDVFEQIDEESVSAYSPRYFLDNINFPVYLIHGANDNMIPYTETEAFGKTLEERQKEVYKIISHLYTHSEVAGQSMMKFVKNLLGLGKFMHRVIKKGLKG